MTTALLIIDVQHGLCTGEEAAFDIDRIVERINAIGAKARTVGAPVILIQHEEDSGSLQFGADGWQLARGLATLPGDLRVRKTTPDSFHQTELHRLLEDRGITKLVICGLQSDCCVDATVRGALALGYDVVLVGDAHSTMDSRGLSAEQIIADHNATFVRMNRTGSRVTVANAGDVVVIA